MTRAATCGMTSSRSLRSSSCTLRREQGRARLEVIFDRPQPLDDWTCQLIEAATQLASMVLELERAIGRGKFGSSLNRATDGAAPLIGASEAIRRVRERIERVAATDFTVLIEGTATGRWRERGRITKRGAD